MDRPRLLVVDDDESTRHALKILFSRRGWEVIVASTVAEGLTGLARRPRLIILDLNLPDGGGETILREVRLHHPGIMVAICSASVDQDQLAEVRKLVPELMLCKPIDFTPIERLSRMAIAG
ncbi:response regulator [Tundrisphaera lichenicola]|uniref:response regulator n=1 Tax=Tundrisphaera lichenicola TaxID=2029860 RepID=UPI003EB6CBF4